MKQPEINKGTAYILWALGFFVPLCGIHRFYAGKPVSGMFYLLTFGFFYIGQVLDAFFIPDMVEKRNRYFLEKTRNEALITLVSQSISHSPPQSVPMNSAKISSDPMLDLLQIAAQHHNVLSIGQAMISLQKSQEETEKLLTKAIKQGLAHVDNDPESGAVRYYFDI